MNVVSLSPIELKISHMRGILWRGAESRKRSGAKILNTALKYSKNMIKAIWAGNTPYSKFLISVGIILVSAVFFTLISTLLATAFYGVSFLQLQEMMLEPDQPITLSILKLVQTVSAIGTFIIPPFILAWLFSERPANFLSLERRPKFISLMIVIILMIVSTPVINYLGEINSHLHLPGFLKGIEDWMRDH